MSIFKRKSYLLQLNLVSPIWIALVLVLIRPSSPSRVGYSQKLDSVRLPSVERDQLLGMELPKLVRSHTMRLLQGQLGTVDSYRGEVILRLEDFVVGDVGELMGANTSIF